MRVEFAHSTDNKVADSVATLVFLTAFENLILFLIIIEFLNEIEYELIAGSHTARVSKLSWVKVLSINNGDVVVPLYIIFGHELWLEYFLAFEKI